MFFYSLYFKVSLPKWTVENKVNARIVKTDDKIPNIARIKFPTYNRTIVSTRGAMVRDYEREIFISKRLSSKTNVRLEDGVFNGEKLFFEIRQQGCAGGKTILKDYIKPFRETAKKKYTVRLETLPGEQMQVDWKEVGGSGNRRKKSQVIAICGYIRHV